jgi:hypothetical protein
MDKELRHSEFFSIRLVSFSLTLLKCSFDSFISIINLKFMEKVQNISINEQQDV